MLNDVKEFGGIRKKVYICSVKKIKDMITEDYVSFEIAKLLKEKGFPQGTFRCHYIIDGNNHYKSFENRCGFGDYDIIAPTLVMAMKWLREVYNIDISVVPHSHKEDKTFDYEFVYWNGGEYHTPYDEKRPTYHELFGKTWEKYEEAVEAAIEYALKNLI